MYDKLVLVVEDDDSIREMLQMLLEDEGYHVLTAANGSEGIEALRKHDRPSLIILDLMMPVMSGWEFLRVKKTELALNDIPVITISAGAQNETPAGASAFVRKPFEIDGLL